MLVSVYLPTKNRAALLRKAVDSVLTQTFPTIELIIVNDGSTDGTFGYTEEVAARDARVRVIHNATSIGAPGSRNLAIEAARGDFVTGLDDDDRFHPQRISAFVEYWQVLERIGESFSCLYSQDIAEKGGKWIRGVKPGGVCWKDLFYCNGIGNQIFAKRQTFVSAGLFDDRMPAWQDLDLFIRILRESGPAKLLDAGLYIVNIDQRADRISSKGSKQKVLSAYRNLEAKWRSCPRIMRQGLYLQAFGHFYGIKPNPIDLLTFFRMGVYPRTLKALAGIYLRRA